MSSGVGAFAERAGGAAVFAAVPVLSETVIFEWVLSGSGSDVSRRRQAIWRDEVMPRSFPRCSWHQADGSPTHPFVNPRPGRPGEPGLPLAAPGDRGGHRER